jgi:predicted regulator of Ras-like GTPase activity (Roadblock/LC7/MglB family)
MQEESSACDQETLSEPVAALGATHCILAHRRQPSRRIAGKKIRQTPIETKREIESIARTGRFALLTAAAHKVKAQHRSWARSA